MNRITSLQGIALPQNTAIALGFFDGVHLGHRAVLKAAAEKREQGLLPVAFTFCTGEHSPVKNQGRIYSDELRTELLFSCAMDTVLQPPFSEIESLSDEEFVSLLCGPLLAKVICCGEDYRFSKGAAAGAVRLRELAARYKAEVITLPAVTLLGGRVSSSRVRELLAAGEIEAVNLLLGAPYRITGPIVHGRQLGRTIDFPTINQPIAHDAALPCFGVYAACVTIEGTRHMALTNIGVSPTVGACEAPRAETHILNFSGDLYGRRLKTELISFLRPEKRFASIAKLGAQIEKDCQEAAKRLAAQ